MCYWNKLTWLSHVLWVCFHQEEAEDDSDLSDYGDEMDGKKDALAEPCFMLIGEIFELRGSEYSPFTLFMLSRERDCLCSWVCVWGRCTSCSFERSSNPGAASATHDAVHVWHREWVCFVCEYAFACAYACMENLQFYANRRDRWTLGQRLSHVTRVVPILLSINGEQVTGGIAMDASISNAKLSATSFFF